MDSDSDLDMGSGIKENVVRPKCFISNSYEDFSLRLAEMETTTRTRFNLRTYTKKVLDVKAAISKPTSRVQWQENIPYIWLESILYVCHQGKDIGACAKKKYAAQRDLKAMDDHIFVKRYKKVQTTKKLDCPAKITVKRVVRFMNHQVTDEMTDVKKRAASKLIKKSISDETDLGEECYFYNFPTQDEHKNHLIGEEADAVEPVDKRVRKFISDLVVKGQRNSIVIAKLANAFAENELNECDRSRRKFFPDMKTIRNIISSTKLKIKRSPIDQENCLKYLEDFQKDKSNNIFFRPYSFKDDDNSIPAEEMDATSSHLLFVFQNKDMKRLYRKYGKNTILLDATYRTCKYALPLYFIVVETNVNYQVVGVMITQFETTQSITEGLNIFRSFNPDITPQYGMVDFAMEEIVSLEEVFENINVFICSFHREQAWSRWLSKSKNVSIPRKEALNLLRKIANAPNIAKMEEAVKTLKEWKHYKESTLKNYFENTWYPEIKRWALAYKPLEMFINSNNGVERLNKELKYTYLEGYKGCSLSEIVSVLLSQFLPERYLTYVRENLIMSSSCRMYSEEIPKYLHGRPKWFVTHVMDRLTSAESLHGCVIVPVSEIHFQIHSTMTYDVNFDLNNRKSSCTCPDFRKERLICKHMIFISIHYQKFDLNLVHELLFDNPIFKCDDELSNYEDENSNNCTIHDKFLDHRHDIEELPLNTHYSELQRRGSNKRHLLNLAKATWRSIESVMWNLDEESLQKGNEILQGCLEFMTSKVSNDESNGLPIQAHEETFNGKSIKRKNYRKLSLHKKQGQSSRVGTTADCLKAARIITITEQDCSPSKRTKIDMLN